MTQLSNQYEKLLTGHENCEEGKIQDIILPAITYISVEGVGHPTTSEDFLIGQKALHGLAFTMKFSFKRNPPEGYFDFTMGPGECKRADVSKDNEKLEWKVLLMQPSFVDEKKVIHARRVAHAKNKDTKLPQVDYIKTEPNQRVIQTLHIGPYEERQKSIDIVDAYITEKKLESTGELHEVYINDLRRTKPEKLHTIMRRYIK